MTARRPGRSLARGFAHLTEIGANRTILVSWDQVLTVEKAESLEPGDSTRTLPVGGVRRRCLVHVPNSRDGGRSSPVVHLGGDRNAKPSMPPCGIHEKVDESCFLDVYPNSAG